MLDGVNPAEVLVIILQVVDLVPLAAAKVEDTVALENPPPVLTCTVRAATDPASFGHSAVTPVALRK